MYLKCILVMFLDILQYFEDKNSTKVSLSNLLTSLHFWWVCFWVISDNKSERLKICVCDYSDKKLWYILNHLSHTHNNNTEDVI